MSAAIDFAALNKKMADAKAFRGTRIGGLLQTFESLLGNAWVAECNEHSSDHRMKVAWDKSNAARKELVDAIVESQTTSDILLKVLERAREVVNAVVLSTHSVSFDADLRAIDEALAGAKGGAS